MIEKDRVEKLQEVKMKSRLTGLDKTCRYLNSYFFYIFIKNKKKLKINYSFCSQIDLEKFLSVYIENYFFSSKNEDDIESEEINIISKSLKVLIDSIDSKIFCLIEYPYTDKLYRDAYSRYFSTLNRQYGRDCIRVSLFSEEIKTDDSSRLILPKNDTFLGYFIVRPTFPASYSRSFLNPNVFAKTNFISCLSNSTALIEGVEYNTDGFPHASQDGIVHSCSETAIWVLMEYFGAKYEYYGTTLPSAIHKVLQKITFQRLIPSRGMAINQIGYTLRKFGFGSLQYTLSKYKDEEKDIDDFKYIVNDYIESGIPIIAITQSKDKKRRHAFLMIGHSKSINGDFISTKKIESIKNYNEFSNDNIDYKIVDTFDYFDREYIIMDDNKPPYMKAPYESIGKYYGEKHPMAIDSEFFGIIVPLYPKIYLDAVNARNLFRSIIKNKVYGWKQKSQTQLISRLLLTSSRSFKRVIRDYKDNRDIITLMLNIVMPKFIYLCEITSPSLFNKKLSLGLIIFDSTSSKHDSVRNNLLAIIYPDKIYLNKSGTLIQKTIKINPIPLYINNLKKN